MEQLNSIAVAIVCSMLASSGFWAYMIKKDDRKDLKTEMLIGLGHDRIIDLGLCYIERGWLTQDEYENINDYLYRPYSKMGGNGTAARIMKIIDTLPIHKARFKIEG